MSGPVMANSIAFEFRLVYQLPGMNSQSVMEAVAELEKDFVWFEEVRAAESFNCPAREQPKKERDLSK
jgi:hypothetical protein